MGCLAPGLQPPHTPAPHPNARASEHMSTQLRGKVPAGQLDLGTGVRCGSSVPVQECSGKPGSCKLFWLPCLAHTTTTYGPWTSLLTSLGLSFPTWECR